MLYETPAISYKLVTIPTQDVPRCRSLTAKSGFYPFVSSESLTALHLFALNCSHHFSCMSLCPKFQVPNSLPGPQCHLPIPDGHRNARAYQRTLDVCGHVIQSLRTMSIQLPLLVLWRQPIQRIAHVFSHIGVPVLVQTQRAGRVLDEEVQQPDFVGFEFGERRHDLVRYEVAAAGFGGQRDCFLKPGHAGGRSWVWCDGRGGLAG